MVSWLDSLKIVQIKTKTTLVPLAALLQKKIAETRNDKTIWDDAKPVVNLIHLSLVVNVIYLLLAAEASFGMSQIFSRARFYATTTTNGPSFPAYLHMISASRTYFFVDYRYEKIKINEANLLARFSR